MPSLAGPKRPQDRVPLSEAAQQFVANMEKEFDRKDDGKRIACEGTDYDLGHGDVVIAAITSCTNTSNPYVMLGAGLIARNAVKLGLKVKPWVKTSLAPGSQVVTEYLRGLGPAEGPRTRSASTWSATAAPPASAIPARCPIRSPRRSATATWSSSSVLSGNRNFEGRVNPLTRANYLASPMLVVVYALAGSMKIDITKDPIGTGKGGKPVYLKDLWPSNMEVAKTVDKFVTAKAVQEALRQRLRGRPVLARHQDQAQPDLRLGRQVDLRAQPALLRGHGQDARRRSANITGARPLGQFGDSITTDHISPAGSIKKDSPAGKYLMEEGVEAKDFNQYGTRRGNHEVMMRGTFANIRLKNEMVPGIEGGFTHHLHDRPARADLRRGDALPEGAHAAGPDRRQGIRHRLARATGRPRASTCWASRRWSARPSSASIARTWSAWACCRCSSRTA